MEVQDNKVTVSIDEYVRLCKQEELLRRLLFITGENETYEMAIKGSGEKSIQIWGADLKRTLNSFGKNLSCARINPVDHPWDEERLRKLITTNYRSISEFCRHSGISRDTGRRWLDGCNKPTANYYYKILDIFQITPEYFR